MNPKPAGRGWIRIFAWNCLAVAAGSTNLVRGAERPELTRLMPSGGQAGTVIEVEATGKFPLWPMQAWSDTDSIRWSFEEGSGKLKATIDASAQPGLHWLRLIHPNGATSVRPFVVSNAPEQIEVEPNNRLAEANAIGALPRCVNGVLSKRGDVDMYSLVLVQGQNLLATVDAEQLLHSPMDANLQLLDSDGFLLEESLDHFGLDPSIEWIAPRDGKYLIRVFGFPATPDQTIAFGGGDAWIYRLRLQTDADPFCESSRSLQNKMQTMEPGQAMTRDTALPIELPARITGKIERYGQHRFLRFQAMTGQQYRLQLRARNRGSQLDATIAILDAQGKQLSQQDDVGNDRDPDLKWKAPADGEYTIDIQDFHNAGGQNFDFELAVSQLLPDFRLSISNDLIQSTVGKETEIEVRVERECDFAGEITVSLEGASEGIECSEIKSIHGSDSAKKVTLRVKSTVPFQGPVRVSAKAADLPDTIRLATTENEKPIWLSSVAE